MESTDTTKTTITRVFRRKETNSKMRRVVTVKYQYDKEKQTLTYAASVWKTPRNSGEKYLAANHLQTVEKRFTKHPIVLENFTPEDKLFDFHQKVRKQLFKHGCKVKTSQDLSMSTDNTSDTSDNTVAEPVIVMQENVTEPTMQNTITEPTMQEVVTKPVTQPTVVEVTESDVENPETSPKKVVTRVFRCKETGGDTRRIITVKYEYDRDQQKLTYGSTIWKSTKDCKDKYSHEAHLKTAERRFNKSPVVIENFSDEGKLGELHQKIRKQLFKHGCRQFESSVVTTA